MGASSTIELTPSGAAPADSTAARGAPPGWYRVPQGGHRWWDGREWTSQMRQVDTPGHNTAPGVNAGTTMGVSSPKGGGNLLLVMSVISGIGGVVLVVFGQAMKPSMWDYGYGADVYRTKQMLAILGTTVGWIGVVVAIGLMVGFVVGRTRSKTSQ